MVRSIAFLPDGRRLFVSSSANLKSGFSARLYDLVTAAPLSNAIKFGSFGNEHVVEYAVLSPDSKRLLMASRLGKSAQLWDLATGKPVGLPIKHPDWVMAVAFRPDGKVAAIGCKDGTARLWDALTAQPLGPPMVIGSPVGALAFSPDGQTLLTACADNLFTAGEARLWNAATGQPLAPPMPHAHAVSAVAFRPDGRAVATGDAALSLTGPGDGTISIWNLAAHEAGGVSELRQRIQVWTGLKLADADRFEILEPDTWQKLNQEIRAAQQPQAHPVDGKIH
jgi:WD40 repeat protein